MKAFFVGLIFLFAVAILSGIGLMLTPLLIVLTFFLRIIIIALLAILGIWLLGKFIIFIWEAMKDK